MTGWRGWKVKMEVGFSILWDLAGAASGGVRWRRVLRLGLRWFGDGVAGDVDLGLHRDGAVLLDQIGDGELQRLNPLAGDGRDGEDRDLAAFCHGGQLFQLLG